MSENIIPTAIQGSDLRGDSTLPSGSDLDGRPEPTDTTVGRSDPIVAHKKFPLFSVILLLILSVVSVICVYLFLQVHELSMSQPVPSPSPSPLVTINPTSTWQIYESKESGISFKYPGDIFIYPPSPRGGLSVYLSSENNVDSPLGMSSDGIMINQIFYPNYKDKDINEVRSVIDSAVGSINESPVQKGKLIKIKNVTEKNLNIGVFKNIPQNEKDMKFFQSIWEINNNVYYIQLLSFNKDLFDKYKELFDQILSTIKLPW
jgi:hypothetical protein